MEGRSRPPEQSIIQRVTTTCDAPTKCSICNKEMRTSNLQRHLEAHKKPCRLCNEMLTSAQKRTVHEKKCRQQIHTANFNQDFQTSFECETAINGRFKIFSIAPINELEYTTSIMKNFETIKRVILELLQRYSAMKFYVIFEARFKKDIHGFAK